MSVVKFSEVAHRANTKEDRFNTDKIYYVGGEHIEPGELFIHDKGFIKGSTIGPMFYCGFKSGQILFVTRNPHLRKCSVAEFDGICSEKTFVIETIDKRILLQEYLASVMLSDDFWNYCEENKSGGVNYFLNWSTLADYEFELPSVEEQKAISDKVWAAYRLKESYKKLLAATEEMVKSQFIEMFGCLAERVALSSLCDTFIDGDWIEAKDQSGSGIRLIQTGNVGVGTFKDKGDRARYISEETFNRLNCTEVVEGDILISRLPEPVGRACIIPAGLGKSITAVDCTIIRLNDKVLPKFFVAFTNTPDYAMQIKKVLSGTTRLRVSRANLGKIQVPLPSIDKQQQFVTIAEQADKSGFGGFKSQFIEMFGDTHVKSDNSRQWKEVVEIINGKDYKTIQVEDGGYPVYGTGGEMARAADYLSPANSILLGRKGTIDKPLLIKEKYWNVDTAFGAVPDENILNYVYFYWHCKTIDFNILNKGTTLPSTTKVDLLNLWVKIPAMEEQNRFASIVEQADKSGFVGFKSQFIEMFGIAEATKPLADFVEVSFPGEWGQEDKDGSGVKVIRTTNFTNNGKLDLSEVVTRDIDSAKIEKKKLFKGDIILERSGGTNDNPVGRVVYFEEDGVYLFNNFTQLLRCKEGVNSLFIFYSLFNYYQMNKNVIRSMGNKTTGIQNLKMDRYWQIPIADVSIELQKEFESIYRQADKSGFRTQQIH